jgi:hypothetical protein
VSADVTKKTIPFVGKSEEMTARIAYVDFDGKSALEAVQSICTVVRFYMLSTD